MDYVSHQKQRKLLNNLYCNKDSTAIEIVVARVNISFIQIRYIPQHLLDIIEEFCFQFYPNEGHNLGGVKLHLFNTVLKFLHQCFEPSSSHRNVT